MKESGLTEIEKSVFINELVKRGWSYEDGTIFSPERGLWFSQSHFQHWSLKQFEEIFENRANRIENAKIGEWKKVAQENRDASEGAREIIKNKHPTNHSSGLPDVDR